MKSQLRLAATVAAICLLGSVAQADYFNDGQSVDYYKQLKGKKVVFVPLGMSLDIDQGWVAGMQRQAEALGYQLTIRDPNWNEQVGAQAVTAAIDEKPDLLIVQNPNMQVYSRLLKKATGAGIPVLQVNMKSTTTTDAYVGADWYQAGQELAKPVVKACDPAQGKSGKIAIVQGMITAPGSYITLKGVEDYLKDYPQIKVVANQAADWDATKAHSITSTVLKQNADLCGIIGFWDAMDVGTAAALTEANMQDKVFLATEGAGAQSACDAVSRGTFQYYVSYDVAQQSRDIDNTIKTLLQLQLPAATKPFALYTPLKIFTKDSITPSTCWSLDDIKKTGG